MNQGIITLSFDDGRKDTYHVFMDILKPRNLQGVVYIPTGYIETNFHDPLEIGYNGVMSKAQLDEISKDELFEISAHGNFHRNDIQDILEGADKLKKWYPQKKDFGFASPHSLITRNSVIKDIDTYRKIGFKYVRGGRNFASCTMLKRGLSLAARITKSPFIFKICYKNSVNRTNDYYLYAIPIHKLTTLEQVKTIIDYCTQKKVWAILEFHGIDKVDSKEYTEEFCWLEDDFVSLCDYIVSLRKENKIAVETPLNALRIMETNN